VRITFVLPNIDNSGGIRVIATYAELLRKRGHEVVAVSVPLAPVPLRRRIKSMIKGKGRPQTSRNESTHFTATSVIPCVIETCRPITDRDVPDADIVIATWWETAPWVHKLSPQKGAKCYFIQGDERVLFPEDPSWAEKVRATWSLPLRKIVVSRWLAELIAREAPGSHVELVPNSVDTSLFSSGPRDRQPVPTVGMVYANSWFRGLDVCLAAIELARQQIPNLHVMAFGHDACEPGLNMEYFRNPPQHKIRSIYSHCDAWLFGSRKEGFGLPILEAMACRTPVIATPAGAAPELLARGGGILVKPEDPADMACAIVGLCQMPAQNWKSLSDAALQTAAAYTWQDASLLFEKALESALDHPKPSVNLATSTEMIAG